MSDSLTDWLDSELEWYYYRWYLRCAEKRLSRYRNLLKQIRLDATEKNRDRIESLGEGLAEWASEILSASWEPSYKRYGNGILIGGILPFVSDYIYLSSKLDDGVVIWACRGGDTERTYGSGLGGYRDALGDQIDLLREMASEKSEAHQQLLEHLES